MAYKGERTSEQGSAPPEGNAAGLAATSPAPLPQPKAASSHGLWVPGLTSKARI